VRIESQYDREERGARAAVAVGIGLVLLAVGLAFLVRYRPDVASLLVPLSAPVPSASQQEETAELARSANGAAPVASPAPRGPADSGPDSRRRSDTTFPGTLAVLRDTSARVRSWAGHPIVTDVVLLPCSTANPRPDGSVLIPPHNPGHRTVIGLPQHPGDPPRGFVLPPHDPNQENQVLIEVLPMDSILAHTVRVPPHDPATYNVVRPESMSCLPDSSGTHLR
jgi:hypothetical protein